jgi:hypothetical protein
VSQDHPPSVICNVASCLESRKMFLQRAVIGCQRNHALATGKFQRHPTGGPIDADSDGAPSSCGRLFSGRGSSCSVMEALTGPM